MTTQLQGKVPVINSQIRAGFVRGAPRPGGNSSASLANSPTKPGGSSAPAKLHRAAPAPSAPAKKVEPAEAQGNKPVNGRIVFGGANIEQVFDDLRRHFGPGAVVEHDHYRSISFATIYLGNTDPIAELAGDRDEPRVFVRGYGYGYALAEPVLGELLDAGTMTPGQVHAFVLELQYQRRAALVTAVQQTLKFVRDGK